jgi:hypothetical protein
MIEFCKKMLIFGNMHQSKDPKVTSTQRSAWLSLTVIGLLIAGAGALFVNNRGMLDDLRAERVSSELILNERNFALQEVRMLKRDFSKETSLYTAQLDSLQRIIASKEVEMNQLSKQKQATPAADIQYLEVVQKIQSEKESLEKKVAEVEKQNANYLQQITQNKRTAIANEKELDRLSVALDEQVHKAILFDMEARRTTGGSLTVKARNARAMHIEFTLAKGTLDQNAPLYVTLTNIEQGKDIPGKELPVMIPIDGESRSISPVKTARWEGKGAADRMELDFPLDHKLSKGIYQVDVYSDSRYLGGSRIRLQ